MKEHNIDYLKRLAKNLKKEKGLNHHEALNEIVQNRGFSNWTHFIKNPNANPKNLLSDLKGLQLNGFSNDHKEFDPDIFSGNENIEILRREIRKHFRVIKSFNLNRGSYGLKHDLERHIGKYVSNGELIYAMYLEGFNIKRNGINCYFNISLVSLRNLRLSNKVLNSFKPESGLSYDIIQNPPRKFEKFKYNFNLICWLKLLDEIPKRNLLGILGSEIDESAKTIKKWFDIRKEDDFVIPENKLSLLSRVFRIKHDELINT